MTRLLVLICIVSWSSHALTSSNVVVIDHRMQAGRDLSTKIVSETTLSFKVLKDRGIIEQSAGRLSYQTTPILISTNQSFRTITGPKNVDGSFKAEVDFQKRDFYMTGPDNTRQVIPDNPPLSGVKISSVLESTGKLRKDSLVITGVESGLANQLRSSLVSVVEQLSLTPPVQLSERQSHQQVHTLEIPVPGIDAIKFDVTVSRKLVSVADGIAVISSVFDFKMSSPYQSIKVAFDGKGDGTQHFNIKEKVLSLDESTQTIRFTVDSPLGLVEGHMVAKTTQTTRFTPLGVFR